MPRPDALVVLDTTLPIPPYRQIFEQVRAMIERGVLGAGDALPPVRQLASDLNVAPNTVARAYADLKAEGWVTGEERRLARVAASVFALTKRSRRRVLGDAVATFVTSLIDRGYAPGEIAEEIQRRLVP